MFVDWWSPEAADWASLYATRNESLGLKAYALVSHLSLAAFVARAVHYRNWFAAVLGAVSVLLSLIYHVCLATDACLGTTVERTRENDRLSATIQIITFASFFLNMPRAYAHAIVPLQLVVVGLAQSARPYSLYPVVVALVVIALGFIARALVVADAHDEDASCRRRRLFWPALVGSVVCACIAVVFFLIETETSVLHSSWHVFAGGALFLALEATHGQC